MNKGFRGGAHPPQGGGLGGDLLKGDLLVLVLREIAFPRVLVLRRVCRKWDNAISDKTRFQIPYVRYRLDKIVHYIKLLINQGVNPNVLKLHHPMQMRFVNVGFTWLLNAPRK